MRNHSFYELSINELITTIFVFTYVHTNVDNNSKNCNYSDLCHKMDNFMANHFYTRSAIFQCFLTAKYPTTAANIKPIGTIKTPILSIFNILQSFYISIQLYISDKNCYGYKYKNHSKNISIITTLLQKVNCISTKTTSYSSKYYKFLIQSINNLCNKLTLLFIFQNNFQKA